MMFGTPAIHHARRAALGAAREDRSARALLAGITANVAEYRSHGHDAHGTLLHVPKVSRTQFGRLKSWIAESGTARVRSETMQQASSRSSGIRLRKSFL